MNQANGEQGYGADPYLRKDNICKKFQNYDLNKQYSYDEILFILDEKSQSGKCDRDIAQELFNQSANANNKATLNEIIFKYVQNVQTSKLCLTREQRGQISVQEKLGNLKGSKKTYVFLKLIQITAHARYSSSPSLSYKIWPTDIPPVTVINSLNPILNHQYTLELETDSFSIIFYQSGVKIAEWTWPDSPECIREGEYHRSIMTENISFQLKINYKPINSHPKRKELQDNLTLIKNKKDVQITALKKLQSFQPFDTQKSNQQPGHYSTDSLQKAKDSKIWRFTQQLFICMPFLRRHLRNLYYALICLIVVQCVAAIWWPMEFLDITAAFASIGLLYDRSETNLGMPMLVLILTFLILIVKSIWGIVGYDNGGIYLILLLLVAIVIKIICIFLAWLVSIRSLQVPNEREVTFYEGIDQRNQLNKQQEINMF